MTAKILPNGQREQASTLVRALVQERFNAARMTSETNAPPTCNGTGVRQVVTGCGVGRDGLRVERIDAWRGEASESTVAIIDRATFSHLTTTADRIRLEHGGGHDGDRPACRRLYDVLIDNRYTHVDWYRAGLRDWVVAGNPVEGRDAP